MKERDEMGKTTTAGDVLVQQLHSALPVVQGKGQAQFTERELVILDLARRQANDIAALEELLAEQGPTVTGSMGQQRLNPIFAEVRLARASLARILAELRMPDDGFADNKSLRKVRAANYRRGGKGWEA